MPPPNDFAKMPPRPWNHSDLMIIFPNDGDVAVVLPLNFQCSRAHFGPLAIGRVSRNAQSCQNLGAG